jgi:ADP-ribose pyrophosphatase YjhB (NUDIX family)
MRDVHDMSREEVFFAAIASRGLVRPSVRAIIHSRLVFMVQQPTDDQHTCFAFIGGEYEVEDTIQTRIRKKIEEETPARVIHTEYRFMVENRFTVNGKLVQALEHYV